MLMMMNDDDDDDDGGDEENDDDEDDDDYTKHSPYQTFDHKLQSSMLITSFDRQRCADAPRC